MCIADNALFDLACGTRHTQAGAFRLWDTRVQAWIHQRKVLQRVMGRLLHRTLASALTTWHQTAASITHQRKVLQRVMGRLLHRTTAAAFDHWQTQTETLQQQRRVLSRVLSRMMHASLAAALATWHQAACSSRHQHMVLQRVMGRLLHRSLAAALTAWHQAAGSSRYQQVVRDQCHELWQARVSAVFQRFFARGLLRWVWVGWKQDCADVRRVLRAALPPHAATTANMVRFSLACNVLYACRYLCI